MAGKELYLSLPTGARMPAIGYGTWQAVDDEFEMALNAALEAGYRHIDTAAVYRNEHIVGKVVNKWISDGKLKREDVFIVTKLPPPGNSPKGVDLYLNASLKNLNLDYIDLYLIHAPFGLQFGTELEPMDENGCVLVDNTTDHLAIWKALESYMKKGCVKAIGLSNFNEKQIERVYTNAEIKPANLQVELHVYCQQKSLVEYCKKKGITVTAYSPLGSRGLVEFFKKIGHDQSVPDLLNHPKVKAIADRLNRPTGQILLRFLLQQGISVIPKSVNPERLVSNFKAGEFELSKEDMETLKALDQGEKGRIVDFSFFKGLKDHPEYPF